ncbi:MAG: tRNA (adenosine(37)-N6)-threonylcarbamoyltransferase complex dimerization subunit type 1 TsaB [Gammaproteobacteria bacterium]|nr:tRNA (adenosine(37)-N6)-threonylcarbamoyltransferase complex dimerization subunit type 1 TsaB [Gammaproteobacteria bacterium]
MTKLLAFDTSTHACSVALSIDDDCTVKHQLAPRQHSDILLNCIDELMQAAGIQLTDLDAIAYGAGPGSFMGVRLATAVAQGLAFGANLAVISVSTLQVLAQTALDNESVESALVGWDARMQQIYWGLYQSEGNLMQAVKPDCLSDPEKIIAPNNQYIAVGNAWEVYQEHLSESVADLKKLDDLYPHAASLAKIAKAKFNVGELLKPEQAEPIYLRDRVVG